MEQFFTILAAVAALVMLIAIGIYNRYDRLRFRLERRFLRRRPDFDLWVEQCALLQPGCDKEYKAAKKPLAKLACIQALSEQVKENTEEKLDLQEELLDFCYGFNVMAEEYEKGFSLPLVGRVLRWMRFRPVGRLDFYPDVHAAPEQGPVTDR